MHFEWDAEKATTNLSKHGVSFKAADRFDFETARIAIDDRYDYGEKRM
jgi:uncharacterized protein